MFEEFKDANPSMTAEEAESFPHKNVITRALGLTDSVEVAVCTHALKEGDLYMLCTDGLSDLLTDQETLRITTKPVPLDRAVAELVDAANRNGGSDNITTLLVQCVAA